VGPVDLGVVVVMVDLESQVLRLLDTGAQVVLVDSVLVVEMVDFLREIHPAPAAQ
jgi:hypothetical protein